jgi:hypothetical protein
LNVVIGFITEDDLHVVSVPAAVVTSSSSTSSSSIISIIESSKALNLLCSYYSMKDDVILLSHGIRQRPSQT